MKRIGRRTWAFVIILVLSLIASLAGAIQNPPPAGISGRWEAEGLPSGPWTFDLSAEGSVVTGQVFQHGGLPGPVEITDGRINGSTVTFKTKNPVVSTVSKLITFTGKVNGNAIEFSREIELIVNGQETTVNQEMGVFGQSGPVRFMAKRTGPVPVPAVAFRTSSVPVDVTGRWDSLHWNLDMWTVDLKSNGTTVTGTVSATGGFGREGFASQAPVPISDGRVDGNIISFKARSDTKTIKLVGKVQGNEIAFTRTVELAPGAGAFGDYLFGSFGVNAFVAKRNNDGAPESAAYKKVAAAKDLWGFRIFKKYEFDVNWQCYCSLPTRTFSYQVNGLFGAPIIDNSVRAAMSGLPPQAMQPLLERYGSFDRLFELLLAFTKNDLYSAKFEFDPKLGYPVSAEVHPAGISTANDFRFTITNFRIVE